MTDKAQKLKEIAAQVSRCQKCPLYKTATQPVFGAGNPAAEIVFVGEAPGYWEDQRGIPFCGAAGNLLNRLLESIKLKRQEVFICNILKHRPPNNRDPLPGEIKACTPFLKAQLLIIKPRLVVTLGRFALNYFLPSVYISRVHGQIKKIRWENLDLSLFPLFHPAAALRNPQIMSQLEKDFLQIPQIIADLKKDQKEESRPPVYHQPNLF